MFRCIQFIGFYFCLITLICCNKIEQPFIDLPQCFQDQMDEFVKSHKQCDIASIKVYEYESLEYLVFDASKCDRRIEVYHMDCDLFCDADIIENLNCSKESFERTAVIIRSVWESEE